MSASFLLKIEKFLGLRCNDTAELPLGASPNMINFKVGDDYSLEKRKGYFTTFSAPENCRGIWFGKIEGKSVYLCVAGKTLYHSEMGYEDMEALEGLVPGEERVNFVPFFDGVYLLTGDGIRRFDGAKLEEVEPHIPTVMISTPPNGAGVSFEEINLLTPQFRQSFSADGTAKIFVPAVRTVKKVISVKINGEALESKYYYWDQPYRYLVFNNVPPKGTDNIEVVFEIQQTDDPSVRIKKCRFGIGFGGANDTRVFLYGNRDTPAVRYHSGVVDGKPCFGYFPATAYTFVGTGAPITSVIRHYDRQLIFTESAAYYSYLEYLTGDAGKLVASFPVLPLSDDRGCVAEGQALLVENTPCTLTQTGLYEWLSTNIRDERNAKCFSDSIARALLERDVAKATLFYRKATSELYVSFGKEIFVYRPRLQLFYYYELPEAAEGFSEVGKELYFFNEDGIRYVNGEVDEIDPIPLYWESGEITFSNAAEEKNLYHAVLFGEVEEDTAASVDFLEETKKTDLSERLTMKCGEELSLAKIRLSLRRIRQLRVRFQAAGVRGIKIRGVHIKGKMIR